MNEKLKKYINFDYILALAVFIALLTTGIITKQLFIKMLPCFISLAVLFLSANANRYAYLLGGINSLIYSIGFYMEGLYGSVAQSVIAGFLFQILIFFRWKKYSVKNSKTTKLREFNLTWKILSVAITVAVSAGVSLILKSLNGSNTFLDSMVFVMGLVGTALIYFGYVDQWIYTGICGVITLLIWIIKIQSDISAITYLIYSIYNLIKIVEGFIKWHNIYKQQKTDKEANDSLPA